MVSVVSWNSEIGTRSSERMSSSVRWVSASKLRIDSRLSPKKSNPHRQIEPGREQVEDAAAHGIFAGFADGGRAAVAIVLQPRDDGIHRHHMAGCHRQRLRRHDVTGRHPLHDGIHGRQHDQRLLAADKPRQLRERRQPLGKDAAMGRYPVIGLAIPGRELQHRKIRREKRQRTGQLLQARPVAAHDREAYGRWLWPRRDSARQIRQR